MGRRMVNNSKRKVKVNKSRIWRRRRLMRLPLNLPDRIWQQYKKSLLENAESSNCIKQAAHTESDKEASDRTNDIEKEDLKNDKKNLITNKDSQHNDKNIFKQLSVNVDHFYAVQYNCLAFREKLNESIEIHKSIYENIHHTKQILTNCSIRSMIQLKDHQNDSFSNHIIFADSHLENVFKSLRKQELLLLSLQKNFHAISIPCSILNYCNIEEDEFQRMALSLKSKQNELELLRQKNCYLQKELQNNKQILIKTKRMHQKYVHQSSKKFSQMKHNFYAMKKRLLRMTVEKNNIKSIVDTTLKPNQFQIQQLQNLMALTNSYMENILNEQAQVYQSSNDSTKDKEIISYLKKQIHDLKGQNKQKNNEIQRLIKAEKQARQQVLVIQQEKETENNQKNVEILKLTSAMNHLQRKHDRWLTDKFHQRCHSIMLFEKMRQIEMQQNTFQNIKKLENIPDESFLKISIS